MVSLVGRYATKSLIREYLLLQAALPKQEGKQNRHTQLVRPITVPERQATGMMSNPKGCGGTQQTPCPPRHGYE
jgi:hypothetical protein